MKTFITIFLFLLSFTNADKAFAAAHTEGSEREATTGVICSDNTAEDWILSMSMESEVCGVRSCSRSSVRINNNFRLRNLIEKLIKIEKPSILSYFTTYWLLPHAITTDGHELFIIHRNLRN